MPANLTPEYKRAEKLFRQATSTDEKIAALELMLQKIPKHKGTDHMQADLKRRLAKLRTDSTGKAATGQKDIFHLPRGAAAGQVVLLGTPNSGKSALVQNLTKAHVHVADYPFSTTIPVPGIMHYQDIQRQLVDMPPITADHIAPGQIGAYRQCDLILLVLDLSAADVTDQWQTCLEFLQQRNLIKPPDAPMDDDLYQRLTRPVLAVCAKSDLAKEGDFDIFKDLVGNIMSMTEVSVIDDQSLNRLAENIFHILKIVRVYTKLPGKKPDLTQPFTLPQGSNVNDLAFNVHRELADKLRYARIWGHEKYPGQQVPREYTLLDKDIIELHFA